MATTSRSLSSACPAQASRAPAVSQWFYETFWSPFQKDSESGFLDQIGQDHPFAERVLPESTRTPWLSEQS